ncbi:MAG TPA: hypothetical protein VIG99_25610 [Myxococcaceae bacterium]
MIRHPGTALLLLALLVAAPGCPRERGHSKAFDDASALFRKAFVEKDEDAFDDPRMQEVERLLSVVPPQSIDFPAAEELKKRIADGRAALEARRAENAQPEAPPPPADPWAGERNDPPPEVPDAGPPLARAPRIGMTVEELRKRFSECFSYRENIVVEGHGRHDVYAPSATEACAKEYPGFAQKLVVIDEAGQKIMGFAPAGALETRYYYPDGGEAPPPRPKP